MKLFIVIFFLSKIIYANTVFEPNKVPNIDYLKKLNQVSELELEAYSKNRIFLMYAYDNIKVGERVNIKCNKLSNNLNLNKSLWTKSRNIIVYMSLNNHIPNNFS